MTTRKPDVNHDIDRDVNLSTTNTAQSAWTFGTLYLHMSQAVRDMREVLAAKIEDNDKRYEQRFSDQQIALSAAMIAAEKAVTAALTAAKEAVLKAEVASDKRFESVNEFRQTLSDQANTFMPRAEADGRYQAMTEKLNMLADRYNKSEGRGNGLNAGWGYLIGAIGVLLLIGDAIMNLMKLGH